MSELWHWLYEHRALVAADCELVVAGYVALERASFGASVEGVSEILGEMALLVPEEVARGIDRKSEEYCVVREELREWVLGGFDLELGY